MSRIYVFSGPCGCGKTTLSEAYAAHLVDTDEARQVYLIHGDSFHQGFVETKQRVGADCPGFLYWPDILKFNWECMLSVAQKALDRGLDVVIDYVVEDELPMLKALAGNYHARLYYVVLTASKEELRERLTGRGSSELIERSLFLKDKLDNDAVHRKYLYDISGKTVEREIAELNISCFEVELNP